VTLLQVHLERLESMQGMAGTLAADARFFLKEQPPKPE
jgi:hypothetical protein